MKTKLFLLLICLPLLVFSQNEETGVLEKNNNWEFSLTPYIWFAGVSADISFLEQSVSVEANFSDVVKNLSIAGLLHAEVKKNNWIIISDAAYLKLKKDGRIDLLNLDTELELEQLIAELALGYNIVNSDDWLYIDVFGGLRYFGITNKLDVDAQNVLDRTINVNDPFVGIRFSTISEKWMNSARIDVGGFGIGSEISWKGNLYAGYRFSELFTLLLGVQAYGIDYEKDAFGLDMVVAGLATGFNFRF